MKGSNVIQRNDYELYSIKMPLLLRSRERNQYIKQELEKLHPRFSSRCSVDAVYHLRKKGLEASVAVMDKTTLASYRTKNRGLLFLEGQKNRPAFSVKMTLYLILAVAFVSLCVVLFVLSRTNRPAVKNLNVIMEDPEPYVAPISFPKEVDEIFLSVSRAGGIIESFSFENGKSEMHIKNVFPELLASKITCLSGMSVSSVTYSSGLPSFSLSWQSDYAAPRSDSPVDFAFVPPLMRSVLERCSASLSEESFDGKRYVVSVPQNRFGNFAREFSTFCFENTLDIRSISVSLGNEVLLLTFTLDDASQDFVLHKLLQIHWKLFVPAKEETKPVPPAKKNQSENKNQIGTILQKDGHRVVFYLDSDGKIKGAYE